jgi:peptidoglycan/xylan/chitin deacetylase (PgdA/CDA1 family)
LALAVFGLGAYVALLLGSVLLIRWRVFADAVVRGPRGARGVALTFDDGPHPRWTPLFLEVLAEHRVAATFFVVGNKAEAHPEVVRAIVNAGHSIGLHSHEHDRLFALRGESRVRKDLERGMAVLEGITRRRPTLFRPPVGHTNPAICRVAEALDLVIVGWTIRGGDGVPWARREKVLARVRRGLRDGAIVLLHDSCERSESEPAALRALPEILRAIDKARLEIVPLERWAHANYPTAAEGSTT